jgi:hypothetical protein
VIVLGYDVAYDGRGMDTRYRPAPGQALHHELGHKEASAIMVMSDRIPE